MILTFVGALLLVVVELLDNLKNVSKVLGLLAGGTKGVERVNDFFIKVKSKLTGLNAYQLNSIE